MPQDNAASRPARVETKARRPTVVHESRYPRGSPSPVPTRLTTTEELAQKFRSLAWVSCLQPRLSA